VQVVGGGQFDIVVTQNNQNKDAKLVKTTPKGFKINTCNAERKQGDATQPKRHETYTKRCTEPNNEIN